MLLFSVNFYEFLILSSSRGTTSTKKNSKDKGKKFSEKPFREAFGNVADLKALMPGCPLIALTASLRVTHRKILENVLLLQNPFVVDVSPNKTNIRMSSIKAADKEDALTKLDWLLDIIKEKVTDAPKSIIFCNVITDISHVLGYILMKLGQHAFVLKDNVKHWLLGVYHAKSWESSKEHISDNFKNLGGSVRMIIATSALGMGVHYQDVKYVIHFGAPCRILEDHIQQLGRGGRNGDQAHDVVIYTGRGLSDCEMDIKNIYKQEGGCLRVGLFKHFGEDTTPLQVRHLCCSTCAVTCECAPHLEKSVHMCFLHLKVLMQERTKRKIK